MTSATAYFRLILRATIVLGILGSFLGSAGAAPTPAPPSAKEVGVLVSSVAALVQTAVKAEVRVKAAIAAVEKAKPASAKAAADNLQKAKVALEAAKNAARVRLDAAAPYVALDLIPKADMEKFRKRMAELNTTLAAIPSY